MFIVDYYHNVMYCFKEHVDIAFVVSNLHIIPFFSWSSIYTMLLVVADRQFHCYAMFNGIDYHCSRLQTTQPTSGGAVTVVSS